jgi:phosphate-selective porin OprO/OprP
VRGRESGESTGPAPDDSGESGKRTGKEMRDAQRRKPVRAGLLILAAFLVSGAARAGDGKASSVETFLGGLKLTGFAQVQAAEWDRDVDNFSIRRARLTLTGDITKTLRFKIGVDLTKPQILLDAVIDFEPLQEIGVRVGQFLLPFSLESLTSVTALDTINRSTTEEALAPGRDNSSSGRDIGVAAFGRLAFVDYTLGFFNGAGIDTPDTNSHKDFCGRVVVHPLRGLAIGGSLYRGKHSVSPDDPLLRRDKEGFDATLSLPGFSLKSEYIHARDDLVSKSGWYVQAGYFVFRGRIEAVLKYDSLDLDRAVPGDGTRVITAGLNWQAAEKVRLQVTYEIHRLESGGREKSGLLAQLQAGF